VKQWVGSVYPPKTLAKNFLRHYSRRFNTIELNSSFYAIPDPKTVEHWRETVPENFRFGPKVVQTVSHQKDIRFSQAQLRSFCEVMKKLGDQLGVSFLQLPPHWGPEHQEDLFRILDALPEGYRLAVEFRHPHWYANHELPESLISELRMRGVGTVVTDTAGRRDVVHSCLSTPWGVVRFLANQLHPSDFVRLDDWTDRLVAWADAGVEEVYFFVHQPDNVQIPELEHYMATNLRKLKLEIPKVTDVNPAGEASSSGQMSLL
jgi:uncharacterized protein YecE (DUF72 family)